MQLIRTTLRLEEHLKKDIAKKAVDEGKSLQELFNQALEAYLKIEAQQEARKIVFKTHNLGVALDHLKREDFYESP